MSPVHEVQPPVPALWVLYGHEGETFRGAVPDGEVVMEQKPFKSVAVRNGKLVISLKILTALEAYCGNKPRIYTRSFKTAKRAARFYSVHRTADWYRRYPEASASGGFFMDFFKRCDRLAERVEPILERYINGNS